MKFTVTCFFFFSNSLGDRLIGRDSGEIQLDAESLTWDPDQTSQTLSCAWRCEVVGGGLCYSAVELGKVFFNSLSGCDTTVQSNHFEAGKSYKIMYVWKANNTN